MVILCECRRSVVVTINFRSWYCIVLRFKVPLQIEPVLLEVFIHIEADCYLNGVRTGLLRCGLMVIELKSEMLIEDSDEDLTE